MWKIRKKTRRFTRNIFKMILLIASAFTVTFNVLQHFKSNADSGGFKIPTTFGWIIESTVHWIRHHLAPWSWLVLTFIILVFTAVKVIPYHIQLRRIRRSNIHMIDAMTGEEFEKFLAILFRRLGYSTKNTKSTRDHGADLVLKKPGRTIVVQAKRAKGKISNSAVQEVVASKAMYTANEAWVVTNSFFTDPARELAKANHVILWDRVRLIQELSKMHIKDKGNVNSHS